MSTYDLLNTAIKLIQGKKAQVDSKPHESIIQGLERLRDWAYPDLSTEDIEKVVRCKRCRYYKRYKKKKDRTAAPFYACSLTRTKRPEDFYCKDGVER